MFFNRGMAAVMSHLGALRPFVIELDAAPGPTGNGFAAVTTGPAYQAARAAWGQAWGAEVVATPDQRLHSLGWGRRPVDTRPLINAAPASGRRWPSQ